MHGITADLYVVIGRIHYMPWQTPSISSMLIANNAKNHFIVVYLEYFMILPDLRVTDFMTCSMQLQQQLAISHLYSRAVYNFLEAACSFA
jgi:hypothetical protein